MDIQYLVSKTLNNPAKPKNYQQMYEQVKKNTAIFIKMVDSEVSKMLLQHKKEKLKLQKQNYFLKEQVKNQEKQLRAYQTTRKERANTASTNYFFQQNTRDIMNCGISEISHLQTKSRFQDKNKTLTLQDQLQSRSIIKKVNQENLDIGKYKNLKVVSQPQEYLSMSMLSGGQISQMKQIKQKYNRDRGARKRTVCKLVDKQSVTQVLKTIRNKALTPRASDFKPFEEENYEKNILEPGTYRFLKKNI